MRVELGLPRRLPRGSASWPQTLHSAITPKIPPLGTSQGESHSEQHLVGLFNRLAKIWTNMPGVMSNRADSEVYNGNRDTTLIQDCSDSIRMDPHS